MLFFKKKFLPAIIDGKKTQTIRIWKYRRLKSGQRSYIPGAGYIRIDSIETVDLAALTDADALPDGFETAEALLAEIATLYPEGMREGRQAYRIRFTMLPPDQQQKQNSD